MSSKPTGPIINGTSTDVSTAGAAALFFAIAAAVAAHVVGLSAGVVFVVAVAVFVVGIFVVAAKTF